MRKISNSVTLSVSLLALVAVATVLSRYDGLVEMKLGSGGGQITIDGRR